ncbi:hypothetical protein [Dyadobacter sp. MSC1_007]|jgi:hypothetical protein|uniref:hypothetical protein n=1 Tax=Dyadobacter sp. MSC1_007 TaxID=2909264 RepID=UPI00202F47D3|nr:hypothetical protein [Dyadobacter sp. MSC1_007]
MNAIYTSVVKAVSGIFGKPKTGPSASTFSNRPDDFHAFLNRVKINANRIK